MRKFRICGSSDLVDGGLGQRFEVMRDGQSLPAFAVRFDGVVHGYLNQCAHVPMELDWQERKFFDESGLYLMCSTHGAVYDPVDGRCVSGPCRGARLIALPMSEYENHVYCLVGNGWEIAL